MRVEITWCCHSASDARILEEAKVASAMAYAVRAAGSFTGSPAFTSERSQPCYLTVCSDSCFSDILEEVIILPSSQDLWSWSSVSGPGHC